MQEKKPEPRDTDDDQAEFTPSDPANDSSAESPAGENAVRRMDDLEEARKNAERFRDQFLRKAAEFENYRKRTESEFAAVIRSSNESLLATLLPVLDDFDRFFKHGREQKDLAALVQGAELIHAKLTRILEQHGLTPFVSVGEPFDVDLHDALLQVPRDDIPPGTVVEEIERGYRMNDRILRHAKVTVSAPPSSSQTPPAEEPEDEHGQA